MADLYVPPQKICHTGGVLVGVGGEILVVITGLAKAVNENGDVGHLANSRCKQLMQNCNLHMHICVCIHALLSLQRNML